MQKEIIQNVKAGIKRKKHRLPKAAAAMIVLLAGSLGLQVHAYVHSFIQARMGEVPEEELTAMADDMHHAGAAADSLSRPYTEEEKSRFRELVPLYREGVFPKGELAQADSAGEAERLGFCFLVPGSTFYLPDRELTDEEMLQIIDFHAKRNYAITKYVEEKYADENEALQNPQVIQERKKEEIAENGGITEDKAVEIARDWLMKLYGMGGDSLECNPYFSEYIPIADRTIFYHVKCTNGSDRQFYSFFIDAENGGLASAQQYDENREDKALSAAEADALLPELEQSAVSFAKERLQLAFENFYDIYYSVDDVLNPTVSFLFVREDNSAFILEYFWDGTFRGYQKSLFSTYEEEYEDLRDSVETMENHKHKGEKTEISIFFEKAGDQSIYGRTAAENDSAGKGNGQAEAEPE